MRPLSLVCPAAVVSLTVAALSAVPAAAQPAPGRAGDGYSGYVACSHKTSAKPSHTCKQSQNKAAFFVSAKHDATYKVCVKFPGKKQRLCASAQPADKGKKAKVTITTGNTGTHKVAWYVDGDKVASWKFAVVEG
jgi:hypothetical protein